MELGIKINYSAIVFLIFANYTFVVLVKKIWPYFIAPKYYWATLSTTACVFVQRNHVLGVGTSVSDSSMLSLCCV
jgi:hypothetical protein